MHDIDLILTITGGLGAALVLGLATRKIGLSPIVGYLLAGVAVGPFTPGYTANKSLADQLAEIGVILLMFGVGLSFHLKELIAVRRVVLPGAAFQILVATGLGALLGRALGWSWASGGVFGLAISVASTVVLTRVLSDHGDLHTATGHVAVGWLVVEDLFTVLALVVLPALFGSESSPGGVVGAVAIAMVKLGALAVFTVVVGDRAIPKLLSYVVRTGSRELFTLSVLVLALGIAVGSAKLFGASMALGAFLAGMVVGRSDFALRAASEALPMRDAFAVLFFVSVGMLFDPSFLWERPGLVLATLAIVLIGKPLAAIAIVLALQRPRRLALSVGVALAQIGEFSFIVASLGLTLKVLPVEATSALVAASIVSITLNPLLYRGIAHFERLFPPRPLGSSEDEEVAAGGYRAVVVGFGPVGRTLSQLLRESHIEPTIVELNIDTVRAVRERGLRAVYGDASRREVLEEAGIANAAALVLSAASNEQGELVIKLARELNPAITVLARCQYTSQVEALRTAGANAAFSGEGEVALAMTEAILQRLGATPEQVDRERERVRGGLHAPGQVLDDRTAA
ncbi:MAG TPA: cation:proton antiporter [Polyangiaceae bacterium]|nr:cation:proton antiporter [Polyangiaceae bacterium]